MAHNLEQEIAQLRKTIALQKMVIDNNYRLLNSKRYRYADKLADLVNKFLPKRSVIRKIIGQCGTFLKRCLGRVMTLVQSPKKVRLKIELDNLLELTEVVYVYISLPWHSPVQQRAHHLTRQLAKLDGRAVIYVDETFVGYHFERGDGYIVVGNDDSLVELLLQAANKIKIKYCLIPSPQPIQPVMIQTIIDHGFQLIYEYIDDMNEDINGATHLQYQVFRDLEQFNPLLILASARQLEQEMIVRFGSTKVLFNANAVNVDDFNYQKHHYALEQAPAELRNFLRQKQKIVGYYGSIARWIDYELLAKIAKTYPDYQFVFIGVDNGGGLDELCLLQKNFSNIHYLGPKKYTDLAKYSYWFDCAIIPFKTGEIAQTTSPVKLFEYMAMGLPTLGTQDLKECRGYDGVVIANNQDEFIKKIPAAIKSKKDSRVRARLLEYAKDNSWQQRAKDLDQKATQLNKRLK